MLEGAGRGHRQQLRRPGAVLRAEHLVELGGRPDVEASLDALGVGVERGREPTVGGAQLGEQEVGRLPGDPLPERVAGLPPPADVDAEQLRVVVEHLLEVRHHPARVDRVAREAAGELVVETPAGHRPERVVGHLLRLLPRGRARDPGGVPQQQLEHHRRRELRCPAEAAVLHVEVAGQCGHSAVERLGIDRLLAGRDGLRPQVLGDVGRDPADLVTALAPGGDESLEHLAEGGLPVPGLVGVVGAGEERLPVRRQHDRHRPAAVAGHRGRGGHVDGVDVGPFLAVDLDADEVLVQVRRGRLVLERLVRHHVAPVAGGVPDREQHRPVQPAGLGERLRSPLPPVDGVVLVLQQVGRRCVREPVGHGGSSCHWTGRSSAGR